MSSFDVVFNQSGQVSFSDLALPTSFCQCVARLLSRFPPASIAACVSLKFFAYC